MIDRNMATTRTISVGTFVASCFATTVGIVVSVSFLTFNLFHRHKRFMKMSSPKLNILISFGGIIMNTSCLMYGMDYFFAQRYDEATVTCQMRLWMIVMAATLMFGPIFAKSWRVYKIFRNAGVKKIVIKDNRLFIFCAILLGLDATILLLWQVIDTLESKRVSVLLKSTTNASDPRQLELVNIQECSCDKVDVWLSLLFVWKSIVFSYGLYIAWKIRNVLLPPMKDSPSIVISVVFTMCSTSLTVVLSSLLRHDPDAVYILQILSITVCCTVVQISAFLPKVMYWWKTPIENPVKLSTSMYEYGQHSEEEMYQLMAENRALKKSLNEKSTRLSRLEKNLETAKDKLKNISQKDFKFDSGCDVDLSELKLDSGLDVDLSETSTDDDRLGSSQNKENVSADRLVLGPIRATQCQPGKVSLHRSNSDIGHIVGYRKQISRTSMCSLQHVYRSSECYNELREFIRSNNDLAGSVAKSYNLDDDEDTLSYVSSYLPLKSTRRKLNYTIKENEMCSSKENGTTLSNDQLYPPIDEDYSSDAIMTKDRPTVSKPKRQKKYRTPKPSFERTKYGDRTVVRKCYYL